MMFIQVILNSMEKRKTQNQSFLRHQLSVISNLSDFNFDKEIKLSHYKAIRVKMKISYHASEKQISILELILNAIIDAYKAYQKRMEDDMDNYKKEVSPLISDYNSEDKSSINQLYKKKSSLKSEKVRNYIAICNSFQPILKGISKLQSIRARSIYERMKFENFICFEWEYG